MARIGYVLKTTPQATTTKRSVLENEYCCDQIVEDDLNIYDSSRPCLKELLHKITADDEIFVYNLSDIVNDSTQFGILMELCYNEGARLVALMDLFDSHDIIFSPKSTLDFIAMIKSLRAHLQEEMPIDRRRPQRLAPKYLPKSKTKKERDRDVVYLYQVGITVPDIMHALALPQRASVYRILDKYGIERNRMSILSKGKKGRKKRRKKEKKENSIPQ